METKSAEYRQEVMTITPTLAGEILRLNSNNRNVRDYMVRQYAQMMKEGRWDENSPATISFYQDGTLADGQHRLLAVKRSGATLRMLVVFGCKRSPFIDTGMRRTSKDSLRIADAGLDWLNGTHVAVVNLLNTEFPHIGCGRDNSKRGEYLHRYETSFRWASENYRPKKGMAGLGQAGVYAAFISAHIAGADTEKLGRAAHYLATGTTMQEYADPLYNMISGLRDTLVNGAGNKGRMPGGRMQRDVMYRTAQVLKNYLEDSNENGRSTAVPQRFAFPVYGLDGSVVYDPKHSLRS